jgi:L-asparaginase
MLPKIAFLGTGGTIASIGTDQFDLLDYNAREKRLDAVSLIEKTSLQATIANIVPVNFRQIDSTAITTVDWADLADTCHRLADDFELNGIVIGHGTASLEETAWALSLVLDLDIPVVLTGSMRPLNGISSDANANLAAAIRVATASHMPSGVFVVANDEIHSPRSVTKTHTLRLGAFQSSWTGPLGVVDGPHVRLARTEPTRVVSFPRSLLRDVPRVDIAYSHVGADGCAINAFVAAGARGIVSAGFGPGMGTPAETAALADAVKKGVTVVQTARTGAGLVVDSAHHRRMGIIAGSDLNPQKARILLSLSLARGDSFEAVERIFQAI